MSIKSRQRTAKQPSPQCRSTKQAGQNLRLVPFKATGLFRGQQVGGGGFGGVRDENRLVPRSTRRSARKMGVSYRTLIAVQP